MSTVSSGGMLTLLRTAYTLGTECIYRVARAQVRGRTAAMGATHTNDLVNIGEFYQQQILPDLQAPGDEVRCPQITPCKHG